MDAAAIRAGHIRAYQRRRRDEGATAATTSRPVDLACKDYRDIGVVGLFRAGDRIRASAVSLAVKGAAERAA